MTRFPVALRALLGVFVGLAIFGAFTLGVMSWGYTFSRLDPEAADLRLPRADRGASARLGFVDLASAAPLSNFIVQGSGWFRAPIVFRTAVIQHEDGTLLWNSGPAFQTPGPSFPTWNPFGRLTHVRSFASVVEETGARRVILPLAQWHTAGGALEAGNARILIPSGEKWGATDGPMPRRYGAEPQAWDGVTNISNVPLGRGAGALGRRTWDVFGDGSVVVIGLRGAAWDECALLVTVESGERYLLVAGGVWTMDQLLHRRPRHFMSSFRLDRNRMQLAYTIRVLEAAHALDGVTVLPVHDGTLRLPQWPEVME
jgi:hypothetical protein